MKNLDVLVTLLLGLMDRASAIGGLIRTAQAEGRDVTPEELDTLAKNDDASRAALANAIANAKAAATS